MLNRQETPLSDYQNKVTRGETSSRVYPQSSQQSDESSANNKHAPRGTEDRKRISPWEIPTLGFGHSK